MDANNNFDKLKRKLAALRANLARKNKSLFVPAFSSYKTRNYCIKNRLYRHYLSYTRKYVYNEIIEGESLTTCTSKRSNQVTVELCNTNNFTDTFVPDTLEPVKEALDFDKSLRYVKFVVKRDDTESDASTTANKKQPTMNAF